LTFGFSLLTFSMSLHRRVLRAIREHALLASGDAVAVALSGGADSVALLWLLHEIDAAGDWDARLAGVIHVNHGLRGEESDRDEAFCRALAGRLSLPIEVVRLDVADEARRRKLSIETAARTARYHFFAEAAARLGAGAVATAHTLEDQAETVLLRLLRGAGGRGVSGIRRRRGQIIRPLLDCGHADLRAYLSERGERFCHDSSNDDPAFARNRVRQRLLPVIEEMWPSGVSAVARFAALAADDEAYLERVAAEAARSIVLFNSDGVQLDAASLSTAPPALGRRIVRLAAEQLAPGEAFGARHIDAVLELAAADRSRGHLDLPALKVVRRGPTLYLRAAARETDEDTDTIEPFARALTIPGLVEVPEAALTVVSELTTMAEELHGHTVGDVAVLQATSLVAPLTVRNRRPGDRFRPLGAPGHRKVQDLFVDRKVPRERRDRVPIVVDAAGQIVWVVGHAIAEACRVTAPETGMVVLKARRYPSAT
jgi:tRNA(Ile)-lysidine synthase